MSKKRLNSGAVLVLAALFVLAVSCSNAEKEKMSVTVDYKLNTAFEAYDTNYFKWTYGGETVEDMFDAAAGASVKGSTKKFNEVRYSAPAEEKKAALPSGLRGLFLYAVSSRSLAEGDALQVMEEAGVITIRFVHRGKAYELMTDKNGNFDPLTGAKIAKGVGVNNDNTFTLKEEFLKEGGDPADMTALDWSKISLEADKYSPEAKYHYEGSLKFELKDGVLGVTGTLTQK